LRSARRAARATPRISRASGSSRKPTRHSRTVVLVLGAEAPSKAGFLLEDEEELKKEPRRRGPGEQDLPAEQQRLADDQREHADIHRVARDPVEAVHDEALGRRPGSRGAVAFEREASGRLEHEHESERHDHSSENPQ
jgi:hypothetical protein